jgi:hypothetical protein
VTPFFQHERASLTMFNFLIEKNKLIDQFTEYNLLVEDIIFIKELIYGPLGDPEKVRVIYIGVFIY